MQKYILSTALTFAASIFALDSKDKAYDVEFYIGKTFTYNQENFNSQIEGRELYKSGDSELKTDKTKIENQIKTQGTITTPLTWNFFDLNYKMGIKIPFNLRPRFYVDLEISSINLLNFVFEDLIKSQYTASQNKHEFYGERAVYKKKPDKFCLDELMIFVDRNFLFKNESFPKYIFIHEDVFKNLGFNEVKTLEGGKIIKSNDTKLRNNKYEAAKFKELENKIRDLAKDLINQAVYVKYLSIEYIKNPITSAFEISTETTKAIKTAFISPSIRYDINLNDNFDFDISAKIGYGLLCITEKSNSTLKFIKTRATSLDQEDIKNLGSEEYTFACIVKQEGYSGMVGSEASLKYNISDAFQVSINFSVNAYGNTSKSFDSVFYKTDDPTKTDISLIQYEKARPEEKDKSCFGLIDGTLSVDTNIDL